MHSLRSLVHYLISTFIEPHACATSQHLMNVIYYFSNENNLSFRCCHKLSVPHDSQNRHSNLHYGKFCCNTMARSNSKWQIRHSMTSFLLFGVKTNTLTIILNIININIMNSVLIKTFCRLSYSFNRIITTNVS